MSDQLRLFEFDTLEYPDDDQPRRDAAHQVWLANYAVGLPLKHVVLAEAWHGQVKMLGGEYTPPYQAWLGLDHPSNLMQTLRWYGPSWDDVISQVSTWCLVTSYGNKKPRAK